jgi:hypothetical protein
VGILDSIIEQEPTLINFFQFGSALAAAGQTAEALEILHLGKSAVTGDLQEAQVAVLLERLDTLIGDLESGQYNG